MEKNRIEELVAKYNEGVAEPAEILQLEILIESGDVELTSLRELARFDESIDKFSEPTSSKRLDQNFYAMLTKETRKSKQMDFASWFSFESWIPKLSITIVLVVLGFIGGTILQKNTGGGEVKVLAQEVSGLKEMIMINKDKHTTSFDLGCRIVAYRV